MKVHDKDVLFVVCVLMQYASASKKKEAGKLVEQTVVLTSYLLVYGDEATKVALGGGTIGEPVQAAAEDAMIGEDEDEHADEDPC